MTLDRAWLSALTWIVVGWPLAEKFFGTQAAAMTTIALAAVGMIWAAIREGTRW